MAGASPELLEELTVCWLQYKQQRLQELGMTEETEAFSVDHAGLCIHEEFFWLAASPDGIVREGGRKGILEIKCPFSQRVYKEIPEYYMDQVDHACRR